MDGYAQTFRSARQLRLGPSASVGNQVVYAVGDIHGRSDLLSRMLRAIHADVLASPRRVAGTLVFLGDYIDRGPHTNQVIQILIGVQKLRDMHVVCLRGNHEASMLAFLDGREASSSWLSWGGAATLKSYGIRAEPPASLTKDAVEFLRTSLQRSVPVTHIDFLRDLRLTFEVGDYVFVHAGFRPGRVLAAQEEEDMLWIRNEFLDDARTFEKVVVHGHTPSSEPYRDTRRIGVDTGAYETGVLTAVRLSGRSVSFLKVAD